MESLKFVDILVAAATATFAAACGGGSTTASNNICESPSDCADAPKSSKGSPGGESIGTPTPADETTPTALPEGGDAPSRTAGPLCTDLAKCCAELRSSGADSSICEAAVAKHDELACSNAQKGYETYGSCNPPPPECVQLSACCTQLKTSGADSSVCEAAVAKQDAQACVKAYNGYKTYGPCT